MVRKSVKITVCTMAAVMAFSGMNITANAAASSSVLPSGGIELTLAKGNKLESLSTGTNSTKQIESIIETVIRDDQMDTTPEASEEESFKNLVIAQVNDYVNVRSLPSEEGEIVGKLYDDSVGLRRERLVSDFFRFRNRLCKSRVLCDWRRSSRTCQEGRNPTGNR